MYVRQIAKLALCFVLVQEESTRARKSGAGSQHDGDSEEEVLCTYEILA